MPLKKSDLPSSLRNSVDELRYSIDASQHKEWVRVKFQRSVMQDGDMVEFRSGLTSGGKK